MCIIFHYIAKKLTKIYYLIIMPTYEQILLFWDSGGILIYKGL